MPQEQLGYALVKATYGDRHYVVVRITKRQKRFTYVETLHDSPDDRLAWRTTTRGLWEFASAEAAHEERARMERETAEHIRSIASLKV